MTHPIVEQMSPSPEQRPAVEDRGRDVVVTAGAGTGKTRTLVARYLSLLAEGLPLRGIAAITFTKKAAREMRNRVRQEVRLYLDSTNLIPAERDRWQETYTQLDAARIGTIHSLCTEILRAHPAEAAVDPRFDVLDEAHLGLLQEQAVEETLAWAADEPLIVPLFSLLGERGFRSTLGQLLRLRLEVQAIRPVLRQDLCGHWEALLRARQQTCLRAVLEAEAWTSAVCLLQESAADDPDDKAELQRRSALDAIRQGDEALAPRLSRMAALDRINLVGGRRAAWPGGQHQLAEVKTALDALRALWRQNKALLGASLTTLDEELARAIPAVEAAFDLACQHYDRLKDQLNSLDFDDLEQGALDLLTEHPAVRERWQAELEAILVDEFQDTNGRQRDLVSLLNGGGNKLLLVGDAKQSIYRFRGADVTVFRHERERIDQESGAVFSLDTSYRAHRQLMEGLNALLRPILGDKEDPTRPWAEPFAALLPHRERAGPGSSAPFIELHLAVGSKGAGGLHRAAGALADRLLQLVEGDTMVMDGQNARPLTYGDVAILCRASTSFPAYEDALEAANIPFLTVAGRGFYGRPEVRDLLNALQAIADPTDDLALVGFLRSPVVGLSDVSLFTLCQERDHQSDWLPLWELFCKLAASVPLELGAILPNDEWNRLARGVQLIAELNRVAGRSPAADLIKEFLDRTSYRAALIRAGQERGARNLSKLLTDAYASGIVSISEFLAYVNSLRDTGAREGEARSTAEGAVQIMSVHAAKGLEFPVVVVGDLGYVGRGGSSELLLDPELGLALDIKGVDDESPTVYQLAKMREDDQKAAELDRLFYVAATRAQERLILSGQVQVNQHGGLTRIGGWLKDLGRPDGIELDSIQLEADPQTVGQFRVDLAVGGMPIACTLHGGQAPSVSASWRADDARPRRIPLPPPLLETVSAREAQVDERTAEAERTPPRRVWRVLPQARSASAPSWVVGSMVHEALAAWRFPGPDFAGWAEARARGYGITDPRELRDAANRTAQHLRRFQAHPLYKRMETSERRLHEVPYNLLVDDQLESGKIDALFMQDGRWHLVEFKTDRITDEAHLRSKLLEADYLGQVDRYAVAMERILGQRPSVTLCLLNYKRWIHLHQPAG